MPETLCISCLFSPTTHRGRYYPDFRRGPSELQVPLRMGKRQPRPGAPPVHFAPPNAPPGHSAAPSTQLMAMGPWLTHCCLAALHGFLGSHPSMHFSFLSWERNCVHLNPPCLSPFPRPLCNSHSRRPRLNPKGSTRTPLSRGLGPATPQVSLPHPQESACSKPDDDILDIPLDDPGANAAAAKIQASFRGHMARKKIKSGERGRKGPGPGGPGGAGGARGGAGGGPSGD